jgi:hypothetical protein
LNQLGGYGFSFKGDIASNFDPFRVIKKYANEHDHASGGFRLKFASDKWAYVKWLGMGGWLMPITHF